MFRRHSKFITNLLIFVGIFLVGFFVVSHTSFASVQPIAPTPQAPINVGSGTDGIIYTLFHWVVEGIGWFVGISGWLFDLSIEKFIIGFGKIYLTSGLGGTIDSLWSTVRDIFNLTFIFGLVFIGFKMILDSEDSNARKMLVSLIGAALLVNFSLFITKFVVDFSNIAATKIYEAFGGAGGTFYIGDNFMNLLGIKSILHVSYSASGGFSYIIGLMLIFLVMAYVFTAGAVLVMIRFAVLNIYLVFSPVMFLGWVFPSMQGQSEKYWSGFLKQAFFAPAFLFMLYLSYRVAGAFSTQQNLADIFPQNGVSQVGITDVLPNFAVIIVFLLSSMVVAKNMGAVGATHTISAMKKIRGTTAGAIAGGAGYFGKKEIDGMANSENRFARSMGRGLTFVGARDASEKAYKNSIQGKIKETQKKRKGELANRSADATLARNITAGLTAAPGSQAQIDFERSIQEAKQPQLIESLKEHEQGTNGYNRIVRSMSHEQIKGLLSAKDDVFDAGSQRDLRAAYSAQTMGRITEGTAPGGANRTAADAISRASADNLAALGMTVLSPNARSISAARMDDLVSRLTPTELQNLARDRTAQLLAMTTALVPRAQIFANKSDMEIARLPREVLLATDGPTGQGLSIEYLNRNILRIMLRGNTNNSYVLPNDRILLRGLINTSTAAGGNITDMQAWLRSPDGLGF